MELLFLSITSTVPPICSIKVVPLFFVYLADILYTPYSNLVSVKHITFNGYFISSFFQQVLKSKDNAHDGNKIKATNKLIHIFLFIICILLIFICFIDITTSHAAVQGGTVVSQIVSKFHDQLSKYENVMLKYAKNLFGLCAILEVAYLGIRKALGASDMRETIKDFCLMLLAAGFFLAVINNYHTWSWNVINGLKAIAGEATTLIDASDRPFTVGLELAASVFSLCSGWKPLDSLAYILAGIGVIICFALITMQIILIKCECIVAMCASAILLGLGATTFFREYAINTLRYVFAVAFKLMTMELVLGVGISFISELKNVDVNDWAQIGIMLSFCIIFFCLVKTLPDIVSGIIQGSHVSTGNGLTSTVTAMGAGMAGLGIAAGVGMTNIGRAARVAKAEGATGVGGLLKGTASNLYGATRQSMVDKDDAKKTVRSRLRERFETARNTSDE